MNMIIVGSVAGMKHGCVPPRKLKDVDIIGEYSSAKVFASSFGEIKEEQDTEKGTIFFTDNMIVELEDIDKSEHSNNLFLAMQKDSVEKMYASPEWLYFFKMSHRFKSDSPHFFKTLRDLHFMRNKGINLPVGQEELLVEREVLTYKNKLPSLNKTKNEFFKKEDNFYVYDHDSIHEAVKIYDKPAYRYYMKDGSEVMTSQRKFENCSENIKIAGVYEEACVLALERSQIPFNFKPDVTKSFLMALEKVSTTITGGYFREYSYWNFFKVLELYKQMGKDDYLGRFILNKNVLRPFK